MSNWPNIQEYRNFEAKFVDDPNRNVLVDSAANSDLETVIKDTTKNDADDSINNHKLQNSESKIVRCVIKKDFEETFKKPEREDGVSCNQEPSRLKPQEPAVVDRSIEKIRLQNHLKWKKQKEEEYLQKKEAEKIAQQKKKEEEERLEKLKKEKEKERMEKLKEWQEQKAREKEEKKKEKMVIKLLEEELKVTSTVDKEKLIEEWVKLKNKQKQIEAEKKAQLLRKEEESKAVRQTLAELSYRQWKERTKGKMIMLPKNGYQIFGPKPAPVVKEDWNHDFTHSSPRNSNYTLRKTDSCSTTTLNFSPAVKELEDLSKEIFYLGNLKTRSSSFYQLKRMKSGLNLTGNCETSHKTRCEMPLKELQQGAIDLKRKESNKLKNVFDKGTDLTPHDFLSKYCSGGNHLENDLIDMISFPGAQGDHNGYFVSPKKKPLELRNTFPDGQILPNKKKLDLYINTCSESVEENTQFSIPKKKTVTNTATKNAKEGKKKKIEQKDSKEIIKSASKEEFRPKNHTRSLSLQKFSKTTYENLRLRDKKPTEQTNPKTKLCRRSQSCEKSPKKFTNNETGTKNCSASKSMVKVTGTGSDLRKTLTKSKTSCSQKRKTRKLDLSEVSHSKSEKKLWEVDHKNKKKPKRKNSLSKSFSFIDSPYCSKSPSKTLNRIKTGRKRNTKDIETKSDEGGRRQKLSTTKYEGKLSK